MISIIIPTLNRSEFLIRALTYYNKVNFKGTIHIGDSSDEYHSSRIKDAISSFKKNLSIVYRHFPKPEYSIEMCFKELVDNVETPYCVYSGDDDFLIPESLQKCADFLETNPHYIAAHGLRVNIGVKDDKIFGPVEWALVRQGNSYESENASERWTTYMRNAISTQYYVHRSSTWREMYRHVKDVPIRYFGEEVLPCSMTTILGKVKQLDCLSTVFQKQQAAHSFSWLTHSMYWLLIQPEWSISIQTIRRVLSEAISEHDKIEIDKALEVVDRELWLHISRMLDKHFKNKYYDGLDKAEGSLRLKAVLKRVPIFVFTIRIIRQYRNKISKSNSLHKRAGIP